MPALMLRSNRCGCSEGQTDPKCRNSSLSKSYPLHQHTELSDVFQCKMLIRLGQVMVK